MLSSHTAWARLGALSLAQVVAWGVLYYVVLVLAPAIALDTGWSEQSVFGAITAGLIAAAVLGVPVGAMLDRRPRRVMVCGSIVATLALLGAAVSPSLWIFAIAWVLCGIAQSTLLYQAAFTVIAHRYEGEGRTPLTIVTLAGGVASTIFAPIAGALVVELGWRATLGILAAVFLLVVLPAYAFTVEREWPHREPSASDSNTAARALRTRGFWILSSGLALMSFSLYAVTLSVVPASIEKAMDLQTAAWVLGLVGVGQVLGRVVFLVAPHASTPWTAATLVGALGSAALVGFALANVTAVLFMIAIGCGAIRGAFTLVQASAVTDRWGALSYGRLNGALVAPVAGLTALAPAAAALLAGVLSSYSWMAIVMAAICLIGGLLVIRR